MAYAELDQIFQTAGGGMRLLSKDFDTLRVNNAFTNLSGASEGVAVGGKCYESLSGPFCHTPQCSLTRIIDGEERIEQEVEKERIDGTKIQCMLTATPFMGTRGELIGIVEEFRDITERNQIEKVLKEREAWFNGLLDSVNQRYELFDFEMFYREISKSALKSMGLRREDVIGKHVLEIRPSLAQTTYYPKILKVLETGIPLGLLLPETSIGEKNVQLEVFKVLDGLGVVSSNLSEVMAVMKELARA